MDALEQALAQQLRTQIRLLRRQDKVLLDLPLAYPDGDRYSLHLSEPREDWVRISDAGQTLMRLGGGAEEVFAGHWMLVLAQTLSEAQVKSNSRGEFFVEVPQAQMLEAAFRLGQTLGQIYTLGGLAVGLR